MGNNGERASSKLRRLIACVSGKYRMKKLAHLYPLLVLVSFCIFYTWMNITKRMFVERFGCGCPPLDGSWNFNTNHLTKIVLGLAAIITAIPYIFLERRVQKRLKKTYFIFFFASIVIICLFTMARNFWF